MPQPGEGSQSQPSVEDSFLDLLADTLEGVDESARGSFLKQFFRTIAHLDLSDALSNESWERIVIRRREMAASLGKRVSLKTAMLDVLASMNFLRVPILIEYEEFKKLQINAATDGLTGLYNRRLFDEYCEKELNRAKRYNQHLAIVILDLHKLKEVNDRFGHLQGDQALQLAASTFRKTLRTSDFAFRIGGDEFALLLPQTEIEQTTTLCRRVRAQYEEEIQPLRIDIGVTLDFGIAVYPGDGDSKSALMRLADERLYNLKNSTQVPPPRVVSMEAPPPRRESAPAYEVASRDFFPGIPPSHEAPPPPKPFSTPLHGATPPWGAAPKTDRRKWERVPLTGTKAHAQLAEKEQKTVSVIDLSYGGVALLVEKPEEFPNVFNAVLHVPILPPVRVSLKKTYTLGTEKGSARIGCSFVS